MDTITINVLEYLVSVVVAGIVINLVAAYLKPYVDVLLVSVSSRAAAVVARRNAFADHLLKNPQQEVIYTVRVPESLTAPIPEILAGLRKETRRHEAEASGDVDGAV